MRTSDGLLTNTWDIMQPSNHLWQHFPMERCKPNSLPPIKKLFRTVCPLCKTKLSKREVGPVVESRHSIYLFKFWICDNCEYMHGQYFLDLGEV